jgi:hypothetical protein
MKTVVTGPVGTAHLNQERSSMAATKEKTEAPKKSLPVNHPQAGYVEPDLSAIDGRDPPEAPPEEEEKPKSWQEARDAREAEVKAIAEAEDKAASEEEEAAAETEEVAAPAASRGTASA